MMVTYIYMYVLILERYGRVLEWYKKTVYV